MALNSISVTNYYLKEIEENESIPPPTLSLSGQNKTISVININLLYNKYNFASDTIKRKSKSFISPFHIYKLYENFFTENFQTKNNIDNNKEKKNKYRKSKNRYKNLKEYKNCNNIKPNSYSVGIKNKLNLDDFNNYKNRKNEINYSNFNNSMSDEQTEDKNNLNKRINNKRIIKKGLNKEIKINNILEFKKDKDKPMILINESLQKIHSERKINKVKYDSNLCHTSTEFHSKLLLTKLKNVPYIRKKVTSIKKPPINKTTDQIHSMSNAFSIKSEKSIKNIKTKKKPINLGININKRALKGIFNISQFNRILKNNSSNILHILRFFDYFDLINLLRTKNKKLILLLNKSLAQEYYSQIKKEISQYQNFFELIKCEIVYSKIKEALKVDLIINIRLREQKNVVDPLFYKLAYTYNFYQKKKNSKELITKEESELQNKIHTEKICDYYSFDYYPSNNNINKSQSTKDKNRIIFISKELPIIGKDSNNIATVQPILPLEGGDQGFLNFEIYNAENGFINANSIKIYLKYLNLKYHLKKLKKIGINDIRISDYEELCSYWKNINLYQFSDIIKNWVKGFFGKFFEIKNILFENVGILIFKVHLKAVKIGEINSKKQVGINIKIKGKYDAIKNEIRKNNLLFERREVAEIKIGDEILYYFCLKQ